MLVLLISPSFLCKLMAVIISGDNLLGIILLWMRLLTFCRMSPSRMAQAKSEISLSIRTPP